MSRKPSDICLICCSRDRWSIENTYLSDGSGAAKKLAMELGYSHSAYYRHINGHISLSVGAPPVEPSAIEWVRATMNLSAAVEAFRIITDPKGIQNIAILVGRDDKGQFIELALLYTEGAIDTHQAECMAYDLNLDLEDDVLTPGITPTHRMSAKLYAPRIFVGRRRDQ